LIAVDASLRFAVVRDGETLRGRLLLPAPQELGDVPPVVAASRRFAVACMPWSSSFAVYALRGGSCAPAFHFERHTRPVTALALARRFVVSGGRDCTLRLARIRKCGGLEHGDRFLAKSAKPIAHVRVNDRLREAVAVSRDGFLIAMSLTDGRYLRGVRLSLGAPAELAVSDNGLVAVCYNGADSHTIIVMDQNLEKVAKRTYDGRVQCWETVMYNGCEWLIVGGKKEGGGELAMLQLPEIGEIVRAVELPFVPELVVCVGEKLMCYIAAGDGRVSSFHFGM
jgi:hypothetical protein